ncbi:uncharacterized protein KY384_000661 [Bacidia gigantensis]|uniref:uncharacterized protein n=1 Tax=Bacidia gigantensis TaxID=2732470 RepID=UPI001D0430A4|nr:uncharacterized protein KY384_000661 [Bacidia gigantensis]KAG8525899.1 hypothetical protein KY384_000661 [Bacidia gigantensis]
MARQRKKKRTHAGAQNGQAHLHKPGSKDPKSMVIRIGAGAVGPSVSQLVKDVRQMMEPGTASRLQERRKNGLRDYTTMAGPLGVSHLLLFSRSESGNTNLRLAITPRGPTLHFRVDQYVLAKDIKKAQKRPPSRAKDFATSPLLVMNNFNMPEPSNGLKPGVPKHLESLTTTVFQSMFPSISPQSTPLSSIRRVLLLNREVPSSKGEINDGLYVVTLRHFAITTKSTGLSRGVRRLNTAEKLVKQPQKQTRGIPNLGMLDDVADYLLDPSAAASGFTSASESEVETDAEVEVLDTNVRKVLTKQQMTEKRSKDGKSDRPQKSSTEKRAVKLVELGPRMRLRMTKVEEGLCNGKVMWHEYLNKTPKEISQMEKAWEQRNREKAERRRIQKENVERKRREKINNKGHHRANSEEENDENSEKSDDSKVEWDSEGLEEEVLKDS